MPESINHKIKNNAIRSQSAEELINELKKANNELREARRAALNVMEDAIISKEALKQSEERLRVVVESAVDFAIINTNTKGMVEAWNSGAEKIFGFTAEEMIGKSADVIFTEEDQANHVSEKEMATAREKGCAEDERWHKRKDGSLFYASGVMRPVYNPELTGYVKVARDMTQQKLLEQQKDDFIAVASHELRTPVTSIKAYTELLREILTEREAGESTELVIKLDGQIDRLIELIHSLLDTTKIAEGQLFLSPENFDLNKLAAEKIEELQHSSDKHTLKLVADKDVFIKADKKRIAEVFTNLISNAIKYSPKGGNVIVATEKKQDGVEVSIKDNGIGIPESAQAKLFGRFFRAKNTQIETYPGMGLGLYIASSIIKKHNGNMWVTSKLNGGSTFYFSLPYQ
jgi:PAS domain S-box-containing protein